MAESVALAKSLPAVAFRREATSITTANCSTTARGAARSCLTAARELLTGAPHPVVVPVYTLKKNTDPGLLKCLLRCLQSLHAGF